MALTQRARATLGARYKEDDASTTGVKTATGLIKTKRGALVIDPENHVSIRGAKTGPIVDEDGVPLAPLNERKNPVPEEEPVQPAKKTRRRKAASTETQTALTKVVITMNGLGKVPSQFAHCYPGNDVLVLGLTELSFVPELAMKDNAGNFHNVVTVDVTEGSWVYTGSAFNDKNGVKNIVLYRVK